MTLFRSQSLLFGVTRRLLGACLALAVVAVAPSLPAQAAVVTFAQYQNQDAAHPLSFISNNAAANLAVLNQQANVTFQFLNVVGAPTGMFNATLSFSATSSAKATGFGPFIDQPFNNGSISIIDNNNADLTPNLLTVTVASGATTATPNFGFDLAGPAGGTSSTLAGDNAKPTVTITYSSSYLIFGNGQNTFSVTLPAMSNALVIGPNGFLASFLSTSQGTFNASAVTGLTAVPVPASVIMLGTGALAPIGMLFARRKRLSKNAA